ncbi:hypothetical protein [Rubrimonas cliftonensis]|uniref:Uncharacterized protein n=1 Tax=Rubrimonas cliftonensis TaxID=89524 RepID=A0A1H3VTZ3_9RHOB|nr:hypothetical protein [Rubrimonas cliftonensis]SDZ77568.1 hypothetical protein SAMN05444370_101290 [Rubrimonas cliftonensis]
MTHQTIHRQDRVLKRRFFRFGVAITAIAGLAAVLLGLAALAFGFDARPFVAALPVIYAPVLLAGVAWLAWTTAAPSRGR